VRRHRLAGPHRARFTGRIVADRKYEIEQWCRDRRIRSKTLSEGRRVIVKILQEPDRFGMDLPFGMGAGAMGVEPACADSIQDCFPTMERAELPV
jgi:hypothetical protein